MSTELSKTYDPAEVEKVAYQTWLDEKCFHAEPTDPGEGYCIVIPPPNVTGALHLGHAINNTLQDILTRKHRMDGFNAVWIPGLDHAGIATQAVVEKTIKEKEGKDRYSLASSPEASREELIRRIWQWKAEYGDRILSQLQRLGCSCDWDRTRFTLDEQCAKAVRHTFFKLFKDGLIYRGKRLVNWDSHLQTSISDDELYDEEVKTSLWPIRYPIDGTDQFMTVATTRPETMLADTAVAVHSDDPRWNWAIGKSVRLPLTGRLIPIIGDPILVDMAFGTGCVKVTPAHDPNDYAVWQRQNGAIAILNLMTPDGRVNDADPSWAAYAGLKFSAARKKVVEDLIAAGNMTEADIKPHAANVKHSDRSKTAIEPYLSDQWFVKMAPLAEPALEVVRDGTIKFYPERHAQQYLAWLGEKRDWPISRQLWWGHRIPVWHKRVTADDTIRGALDPIDRAADDDAFAPSIWVFDAETRQPVLLDVFMHSSHGTYDIYVCTIADEQVKSLESAGFVQDPDVLDTWFSSALWPHSTLGWPDATPALAKWYPTNVLMTGRDIITLWVARMVMTGMYNMGGRGISDEATKRQSDEGKDAEASSSSPLSLRRSVSPSLIASPKTLGIPFTDVAINPTILDEYGKRMSKTAGNGVDPVDIIDTHGADALRFTLTTMATETQDARMPVKILCPMCATLIANPESPKVLTVTCPKCKTVVTRPLGASKGTSDAPLGRMTSDKFDLGRNFCTKLWNAARFVLSSIGDGAKPEESGASPSAPHPAWGSTPTSSSQSSVLSPQSYTLPDRWIVSRFNRAVAESNAALKSYRFDVYAKTCYDFFWRDFCDWYVESIKPALKDPARAGQTANVLASVLDGALRLMHPLIPFITETLWWKLNETRPTRGLPGRLDPSPASARLIKAQWPRVGEFDVEAEHVFPRIQEIVGAIRNVRNDYKVDAKKPVNVSIAPPGEQATAATRDNAALIELLALCTITTIAPNLPQPANSARAVANGDCEIFVENVIDPEAEKQRGAKQIADLEKQEAALVGRLSNPGYMAKAPPHLVQQTNEGLAAIRAELAKLRGS